MAVSVLHGDSPLNEVEDFTNKDLLLHQFYEQLLKKANSSLTDKHAVICGDKTLTFGQLNSLANRLARSLSSRIHAGLKDKLTGPKLIGVSLAPSERLVATLLAILKCGGAYLPLDSTFPPTRLHHILTDAKPLLIIQEGQNLQNVCKDLMGVVAVDYEVLVQDILKYDSEDLGKDEGLWRSEEESSDVTCVLYTSGSTGIPKGVVLPHKVVLNRLRWQWSNFPFQDNEVCCFKTVLTFVDSVAEIFAPLLQGHMLVVIPMYVVQDPALLVAELEKRGVQRLVLVSSLLRALLAFAKSQGNCENSTATILLDLNLWVSSGEPLTESLLREFFLTFPTGRTICNFYGSTEVMADVTYSTFSSLDDVNELVLEGKVPIGMPVDNTNIYILDENLQLLPLGEMGEVYVSGLNVAAGYLSQTKKTDERFIPNSIFSGPGHEVLYRTGDFGRIINGLLYYEGRRDSQIKVRGQRVDLSEIQRAASQIPGISKAVVLCYQLSEPAQTIVLFYLPTEDKKELTEAQVTSQLHHRLVSYMMPYVIKMHTIPLLHNGKVDRQALLRHFEEATSSNGQILLDLSGIEEEELEVATALLTVTATVIYHSSQGRWCSRGQHNSTLTLDADFFLIGGNSLNALEVLGVLRDRGYHISVADFLQASSLRQVLQRISFDPNTQEITQGLFDHGVTKSKYSFIELLNVPPDVAITITAQSFVHRGDLELLTKPTVEEAITVLRGWWSALTEARLSFAVMDNETKEIVGVALNFDAHNEPAADAPSRLQCIFEFLEFIERPTLLNQLPSGPGTVVHTSLLATALYLPPAKNVFLVQLIEQHNIDVAKQMGYKAILTTNTSALTKDICQELFGYQIFSDVQVNSYKDKDGRRVFSKATDDQHVYVAVRFIG